MKAFPIVGYSFCRRPLSQHDMTCTRRETYNLSHSVHRGVTLFIVCFEPEDESGKWLASKRLHCC